MKQPTEKELIEFLNQYAKPSEHELYIRKHKVLNGVSVDVLAKDLIKFLNKHK